MEKKIKWLIAGIVILAILATVAAFIIVNLVGTLTTI